MPANGPPELLLKVPGIAANGLPEVPAEVLGFGANGRARGSAKVGGAFSRRVGGAFSRRVGGACLIQFVAELDFGTCVYMWRRWSRDVVVSFL